MICVIVGTVLAMNNMMKIGGRARTFAAVEHVGNLSYLCTDKTGYEPGRSVNILSIIS